MIKSPPQGHKSLIGRFLPMDKVQYHVLILTAENALIYAVYDRPITHLEVFKEFKKDSIKVKDCQIQEQNSQSIVQTLVKAINKWVIRNFEEDAELSSLSVRSYNHKNQHYVMEVVGRTNSGKPFVVKPSELLTSKINLFSDFC